MDNLRNTETCLKYIILTTPQECGRTKVKDNIRKHRQATDSLHILYA